MAHQPTPAPQAQEARQLTLIKKGQYYIFRYMPGDGNHYPAAPVSRAFYVGWTWSNVLPPINVDGSS